MTTWRAVYEAWCAYADVCYVVGDDEAASEAEEEILWIFVGFLL